MKNFFKDKENRIAFIIFLVTIFAASVPLISRHCINGHDLEYHLLRIESLKEGILIGKPFLKVNTLFFGGAGYASSMFYSDLFMYVPAVLRVLGLGIGASYHIFVVLIFILCYGGCFYCAYRMSGSKYIGTLAAVLITLCPYHMDDMLVRAACGEYMAFIFVPFVIYGVYNVLLEEMSRPWVFGLGYAGLILTHPATLFMCVMFTVAAFAVYIARFIKKPSLILKLGATTLITLLVTAFQWMPMLEQFASARFYVSEDTIDMMDATIKTGDLFGSAFPTVGVLLILLAVPRVFLSRKDSKLIPYVDLMLVTGVLFAFGASDVVPWDRLGKFLTFIQFPWRLFIMSSSLLAIADAVIIVNSVAKLKSVKTGVVVAIILTIGIGLAISHQLNNSVGYDDYADDYYDNKSFTANVIGGEWLPTTVEDREILVAGSEFMFGSDGSLIDFVRERAEVKAQIDKPLEYADVPFIYYKGYEAVLIDESGQKEKLAIDGSGLNGMCRVYVGNKIGTLKTSYKGTFIVKLSAIMSIITVILLIGVSVFGKKLPPLRRRKKDAGLISVLLISFSLITSSMLAGCSSADIRAAAENIGEIAGVLKADEKDFSNPDNVVEYLKSQDIDEEALREEEERAREEEERRKIEYYFSSIGYDEDGKQYAIRCDKRGEQPEISIVSLSEAINAGNDINTQKGLYDKLFNEYYKSLHMDSEKSEVLIMYAADTLLTLEYSVNENEPEGVRQTAVKLADVLYEYAEENETDTVTDYNLAAILAKAAYDIDEWEYGKEAKELAVDIWNRAENNNTDEEGLLDASRFWAAAEIYRLNGQKTFRTVAEAIADKEVPTGFGYSNPGYYGCFAYLSANNKTDYAMSNEIMKVIIDNANGKIKESLEHLINNNDKDEEIGNVLHDSKLVLMANHISASIEYIRYAQDRLSYAHGANAEGIDYTTDGESLQDEPLGFILCGLKNSKKN